MGIQPTDNALQLLVDMYKYALRPLVNFLIELSIGKLNELDVSVATLLDPKQEATLPFPSTGVVPQRFHMDDNTEFKFGCRGAFHMLYNETILFE